MELSLPVVFIMGTTATGKTDAAAHLYDCFDVDIISVDSSLVYRGMDIGTAKPDAEFLLQYPHALVDVTHPNQTWSVADFYHHAFELIHNSIDNGRLPVLVGGTHFYFSALEQGLAELPIANPALRQQISQEAARKGWPSLHAKLAALDVDSAKRIDIMDAQRIQRALEIVLESGKTVAEHNAQRKPGLPFPIVKLALAFSDRSYLHSRIESRFDQMLQQGLEQEVQQLLAQGVDPFSPSMKMIGYRQMLQFVEGQLTFEQMREQCIAATRQLAKRQLTWLRNQANLIWWVDIGLKDRRFESLATFIGQFLN